MKQNRKTSAGQRRGVTIAEVAIAMAIVMIVSISAISLQIGMIQGETKSTRDTAIIQYAEDALDCFNWSQVGQDFQPAMVKLGFRLLDADAGGLCTYVLDHPTYRIEIRANFDTNPKTFEINAVDKDGEEIYRFAYEK